MSNVTLRVMSAGAGAFFGGLFLGWIFLGKPFAANDRAVAATMPKLEAPRPGRVAFRPEDERLADPAAPAQPPRVAAPKEEAKPREPEVKIAAPKPAETKPDTTKLAQPEPKTEAKPAGLPEIFPTRRLKKPGRLPGFIISLLDDDEDD